jgi:hypothetical protein
MRFASKVEVTLNVCAASHVTLEADVTKPGFIKLMVTVPVAALTLMLVPEATEVTALVSTATPPSVMVPEALKFPFVKTAPELATLKIETPFAVLVT